MVNDCSDFSDDTVVIDRDDISNFNPEQILPESPEVIQKLRTWLRPTDYTTDSSDYHKHLSCHVTGTGSWLTSGGVYRQWSEGDEHGLLWIKGIPGSGKSVLAAHLVDELSQSHPGVPVLYFFFRQIIDANHKPEDLVHDWLDQILKFSPPLQKRLKEVMETAICGQRSDYGTLAEPSARICWASGESVLRCRCARRDGPRQQ